MTARCGIEPLGPNHTVVDRLLLLLEQILEDELTPSAAACVHQRATLVELSQLDRCEPELLRQGATGGGRGLQPLDRDDGAADAAGELSGRDRPRLDRELVDGAFDIQTVLADGG